MRQVSFRASRLFDPMEQVFEVSEHVGDRVKQEFARREQRYNRSEPLIGFMKQVKARILELFWRMESIIPRYRWLPRNAKYHRA